MAAAAAGAAAAAAAGAAAAAAAAAADGPEPDQYAILRRAGPAGRAGPGLDAHGLGRPAWRNSQQARNKVVIKGPLAILSFTVAENPQVFERQAVKKKEGTQNATMA